jgi:hypothetical protein
METMQYYMQPYCFTAFFLFQPPPERVYADKVEAAFCKYDANRDGFLSREEFMVVSKKDIRGAKLRKNMDDKFNYWVVKNKNSRLQDAAGLL